MTISLKTVMRNSLHPLLRPNPGKALFVSICMILFIVCRTNTIYAQNNVISLMWAESGGMQSGTFGTPTALDPNENFYRTGPLSQAQGGTDVKLQKFNNEGILQWDVTLNTPGPELYEPAKVIFDNSNLYLIGTARSSLTSPADIFVAKVEDDGTVQYFEVNATSSDDVPADLLYDAPIDVLYICGTTDRNGSYDVLLSAYDNNGIEMWTSTRDHNGNMDGAAKISQDGSDLILNGSSQSSATNWDIVSWIFDDGGSYLNEERNTGIAAASEQLKDGALHNGFLQLTGFSLQGIQTDFKVVCLDANNNVLWQDTYDKSGQNDEGTALYPLSNGFVSTGFVTNTNGDEDIVLRKYDLAGNLMWNAEFDQAGGNDRGIDIIEDDQGNYLLLNDVTLEGQTDVYLFYIEGVSGAKIWEEKISEEATVDDHAISIESDFEGSVYITWEVNNEATTSTYEYTEVNFQNDPEPLSTSTLYISNGGQLKDLAGNSVEDIKYYSFGLYPDHYFKDNAFSLELNNYTDDGVDNDQQQRIDFSFVGTNPEVFVSQVEEYQNEAIFNFYENVASYETRPTFDVLSYPQLYPNIDAFVYSNSEGFKMSFVLEQGAYLNDITLDIQGASGITLSGGNLSISTIADDVVWLKPYSYNDVVSPNGDDCVDYYLDEGVLKFSTNCDITYPYVVQVKVGVGSTLPVSTIDNLEWSTFFGGNSIDCGTSLTTDADGNIYLAGFTFSTKLNTGGVNVTDLSIDRLIHQGLVAKFKNTNSELEWVTLMPEKTVISDIEAADVQYFPGDEIFLLGKTHNPAGLLAKFDYPTFSPGPDTWMQDFVYDDQAPGKNLSDPFMATLSPDNGIRWYISAFGGQNADAFNEEALTMEIMGIGTNAYMYIGGRTPKGSNSLASSQLPPTGTQLGNFPVYDPGDGSFFDPVHPSPGDRAGFAAVFHLYKHSLEYASLLPGYTSVNDFDLGTYPAFCGQGDNGQGFDGAKMGILDPANQWFPASLNPAGAPDFSQQLREFSQVISVSDGNIFFGTVNYPLQNNLKTLVSAPQYQNANGQAYMVRLPGGSNTPVWDTYFGEVGGNIALQGTGFSMSYAGTLNTFGSLAYSPALSTVFFGGNARDYPVETKTKTNFFHESVISTVNSSKHDMYIGAFTDTYFGKNIYNWGTLYGGNFYDMVADMEVYQYNGIHYLLVAGTSSSETGTLAGNTEEFPVSRTLGGWFQQNNSSKLGTYDMVISRFELDGVQISTKEQSPAAAKLRIFPNPSRSVVTLEWEGTGNQKTQNIKVYDSTGKLILERKAITFQEKNKRTQLDVSNLPHGLYVITINGEHNAKFVKI